MKKWDFEGDFMKAFPKNFTGIIGHLFCSAVRDGARSESEILSFVLEEVKEKLNRTYLNAEQFEAYGRLCAEIEEGNAYDFAAHILWRETLPHDQKSKLKATKGQLGTMNDPATEKQIAYLKSLGCSITPTSKKEASDLIGQFLNQKAVV